MATRSRLLGANRLHVPQAVELPWGIRMLRRDFIALVGSVAAGWPLAASAQEKAKVWRIAVLSPGMSGQSPPLQALRQGLREVGYDDGQNLAILWKFGGDSVDELTILADEIVASEVDAIFAINSSAALAAKNAISQGVRVAHLVEQRYRRAVLLNSDSQICRDTPVLRAVAFHAGPALWRSKNCPRVTVPRDPYRVHN